MSNVKSNKMSSKYTWNLLYCIIFRHISRLRHTINYKTCIFLDIEKLLRLIKLTHPVRRPVSMDIFQGDLTYFKSYLFAVSKHCL